MNNKHMITQEFVSISKACKIKNYSVKKVLTFLADNKVIPKESQRKNRIFHTNKEINVRSTGTSLQVIKEELFDYLDKNADIQDIMYTDENKEILDSIVTTKVKFDRIRLASKKRLMFIDAEFKEGNYHEIAWEIWENGEFISKRYLFEKKHFLNRMKSTKEYGHYNRLKEFKIPFEVHSRKTINRALKDATNSVDYIIAHNAYGERQMLTKNNMWFEIAKYLCTSKMAVGFIFDKSPSLTDIILHYKLKYNSNFMHYANEDTKMTARIFFKMLEDAEGKL